MKPTALLIGGAAGVALASVLAASVALSWNPSCQDYKVNLVTFGAAETWVVAVTNGSSCEIKMAFVGRTEGWSIPLYPTVTAAPAHGSAIQADGLITYKPDGSQKSSDAFTVSFRREGEVPAVGSVILESEKVTSPYQVTDLRR